MKLDDYLFFLFGFASQFQLAKMPTYGHCRLRVASAFIGTDLLSHGEKVSPTAHPHSRS